MMHAQPVTFADDGGAPEDAEEERLDRVFFALSDPIRRAILSRLGGTSFLVSELAAPFDISVQAVSRHIQVLVKAGLVQQERTGRISRCRLEIGPIYAAAVWINQYSTYWQAQFDALSVWLEKIDARKPRRSAGKRKAKRVRGSASKTGDKR
jgi:DNA-binding transcriptional ArsR family regulator